MDVPEEGSVIDGFRLAEMIHAGSMATIFRLAGPDGALPLIMKIPRLGPGERAVNVIGFEVCRTVLGAMAQSRHHPTLIAYGDVETLPYLVMEYIDGERLDDRLRRAPMPAAEVARIGSAIALALDDVHRQDVVHHDLKPTNVLFRTRRRSGAGRFRLARHGHFPDLLAEELRIPLGNWVYMAPEQIVGVRCDCRSDIYALGGILYELATGQLPFGHPATPQSCAGASIAIPFRRGSSHRRSRSGCRKSSSAAWKSMPRSLCLGARARCRACDAGGGPAHRARVANAPRGAADARSAASSRKPVQAGALSAAVARAGGEPRRRRGDRAAGKQRGAAHGAARRGPASGRRRSACRIACITVVPPAATLSGTGEENSATGRHIRRLVELRSWAKPLDLPRSG
jgi:hypothetical protein